MMLRNKPICKLYAFGLALLFTVALAGCGGGGGTKKAMDTDPGTGPATGLTPEQMCAAENGRFEADGSCTSAEVVTAEAGTKEDAIAAEGMQTTDAGIGGSADDGSAVDTYTLSIERNRAGTTVEITDSANADKDEDPQFMQAMDFGDGRTMHERDNGDGEVEVVIVTTDIKAPEATPFADVAGQDPDVRLDRVGVDTDNPADSLTVVAGTEDVNLPNIMASEFAAATGASSSVTHEFQPEATDTDDDTPGNQGRDAAAVEGAYNGADGTYTCNNASGGADCTVTVNAKGDVTAVSAGWVFTPDKGATSDVADANYLRYGFWLKKTTKDGATTYNEVEAFADAVGHLDFTMSSNVHGTATYEGGATGVYVHEVVKSDGTRASATSGHFAADAELNVNFGGGDVAVNKHYSLTGTIDNFQLAGEEANTWSVSVKADGFDTADSFTAGTANGGGAEGAINGDFYGQGGNYDHDNDDVTAEIARQPAAIAGEFNANFSNGTVLGGYGVNIKK